jgi:DNA invertase Pin-like site-specific DNA recombinase
MRVIGYARISKARNGSLSLEAQAAALQAECDRRGWSLARVESDQASGGSRRRRAGLARAVASCKAGDAEAIMAVRLDRLSRSTQDFADLLTEADEYGFAVVALDFNIDTTNATGRLIAGIIAQVAAWEREVIGERTKEALLEKKAKGWQRGNIDRATRRKIVKMFRDGASLAAITRDLGIPHRTSVANVLRSELLGGKKGSLERARQKPVSA